MTGEQQYLLLATARILRAHLRETGDRLNPDVAADIAEAAAAKALASQQADVFFSAGIHPHEAKAVPADYIRQLEDLARDDAKCVAIGEIGLDYDKRIVQTTPKPWQQDVFYRLLELAQKYDKPVVIHSLYAPK